MKTATARTIKKIPIVLIDEDFYVRTARNDDRVYMFAEVYDAGGQVPPLKVAEKNGRYRLIDGRHRLAGLDLCGLKEAECEVLNGLGEVEQIVLAINANMNTALPPTRSDLDHCIQMLLARGLSANRIADQIPALPRAMVRKYADNIKSKLFKQRLTQAMDAIAHSNVTVQQAAEQFHVDEETLRAKLSGAKRRAKGVTEFKGVISTRFRSLSLSNTALVKKLIEDYRDGEITEDVLAQVLGHIDNSIRHMVKTFSDWKRRADLVREEIQKGGEFVDN